MEVLKSILYFSLFDHPLQKDEIIAFTAKRDKVLIESQIEHLVQHKIIQEQEGYYFIADEVDPIQKRRSGERGAKAILPKALRRAQLIARFPFVRGVAFSGSFSKNYFDSDSDIDFFVITKHNRLWIARTLLILYKKIFLLNSRKYFCLNYFISEEALEIEEKNRFTATELITLKVTHGHSIFNRFYQTNQWAFDFFHLPIPSEQNKESDLERSVLGRIIESLLGGRLGNSLDKFFQEITLRKWMQKFKEMDQDDFRIALKTTKHISKHHPQNFQKRIIDLLNQKYLEVSQKFDLKLKEEHV